MECKTFEKRTGSAKQKGFKVVRSVDCLAEENSSVSSITPLSTVAPYEPADSLTKHLLEAELKKAQALMYMRRSLHALV